MLCCIRLIIRFVLNRVSTCIAPAKDGFSSRRSDGEIGFAHEKTSAILGGYCMVLDVYVEDKGEFVVDTVSHNGFQSHFLGNHLAILFSEYIVLLGAHGADDV